MERKAFALFDSARKPARLSAPNSTSAMKHLAHLALIPLLAVSVHAQAPAPDATRLAAVEQSDRAFLAELERQSAPALAPEPAPAPVAAAPVAAPAHVARAPRAVTTIELAGPATSAPAAPTKPRAKSTTATTRARTAPERRVAVTRDYASEPVYRGIPVDVPEGARVERRSGLFFRPLEVRRPVVVRKVTTTTVTSRPHSVDRDDDEDDD